MSDTHTHLTHLVAQVLLALSLKFLQVCVTESECVREGTRACERARGREGTKERERGGAVERECVCIYKGFGLLSPQPFISPKPQEFRVRVTYLKRETV